MTPAPGQWPAQGVQWQDGPDLHHVGPPRVTFSLTELLHLGGAVLVLSYAFAIILPEKKPLPEVLVPETWALLSAFLAVSSGFVLHELAHKVVAQRYGHWAEFRAQFGALGITLLIAAFFQFLFAAPGAVVIQGRVTPRENGIISLVGPGTNFVVGLLLLPFYAFQVNDTAASRIMGVVSGVNGLLAVFNLLPIGPFDGRKVWRWNPGVYIVALVLCLALFVLALMQGALSTP